MTSPAPPPSGPVGDAATPASHQDVESRAPRHRPSKHVFGRTLFTEPVLVVTRHTEPRDYAGGEHEVCDRLGNRLGHIVDISQGFLHRAARLLPRYTQRFEIQDANHSTVLKVTKPAKDPQIHFIVSRADETPIGEVVPGDGTDDALFTLLSNGRAIATLHPAGRQGRDAVIRNKAHVEVAHIGRSSANVSPIDGNTYVVEIPEQLPEPLASVVLATTLTLDVAFAR